MTETARTCSTCSLCCRVMGVPEIKPDFEWCPHCRPGAKAGGCTIYSSRPQRCRDFRCQWLTDERFGPHWFPATAKIIVDTKVDGTTFYVLFCVDPACPTRWREEPWFSDIKTVARAGLDATLGARWTTIVIVRHDRIVIGP